MSKLEKVKKYYSMGLWNKTMVENAVKKGWITEAEAAEIIGVTETEGE
jgi:hypothetical protein